MQTLKHDNKTDKLA